MSRRSSTPSQPRTRPRPRRCTEPAIERALPIGEYNQFMPYPEPFIAPMRAELTRLGFQELRTPEQVDEAVRTKGTVMIVVNSVCGCAAGKARPGIALALQHARVPDVAATVFAGGDIEATERAREYLAPYQIGRASCR